MGLGKTCTLVAAAMICKLLAGNVVVGLPLSIMWVITIDEWVNLAKNNYHATFSDIWEWYLLQRLNSVPNYILEIQTALLVRHPAPKSPHELILLVTMCRVTERFRRGMNEITYETKYNLVNWFAGENVNFNNKNLNTTIVKLEYRCHIHLILFDTSISERIFQAMANFHTVFGDIGFLIGLIHRSQKTVWAGRLWLGHVLDSNYRWLLCRDSIHSLLGVTRYYGSFQMHLKIERLI